MKVSERGQQLIRRNEGLRTESYRCPGGFWTIGYGHRVEQGGEKITSGEAAELLRADLSEVEKYLNQLGLEVNQNQFDALASFVYNVGIGHFRRSRLLVLIRKNPLSPEIRDEFARWNKSGGSVLPGLTRRRQEEADLYFKSIDF